MRFPEFQGEWEVKKLGEVATFSNGKGHEKDIDENGAYILINSKFVSTEGNVIKRTNKQLIPLFCNQIVMVMSDLPSGKALAKCFYIENNNLYTLNQRICSLTINEDDSKFIYYSINRNEFYLRFDDGVNQTNLKKAEVLDCPVYLPSLSEQQKTSNFLSLIDERIHTQIKIIGELEILIKGLSEKLFSQEIRFKGFAEKWSVKKLGGLATFYSGGTPLTSKKEYFDGNIPFIRSGEINSNVTEQFINELGLKNSSAKMVEIGDILYALYGATSGEVAISKINGAINQAVLCIKSQQNHYFIYSYLFHKKEYIINKYLQGGQGNLSADIVKQIELPIPTLEEQTAIANFLSAIDTKIQTEKNILNMYQSQKQFLLQNLFI